MQPRNLAFGGLDAMPSLSQPLQFVLVALAGWMNQQHCSKKTAHHERNHQGLDNQLIVPITAPTIGDGRILSRERLGGLLKYYHRSAA
jgi:hypothetical protein